MLTLPRLRLAAAILARRSDVPVSARAYRERIAWFPMISKLPRWVGAGAFALACVAGAVNVVGLLGFEHQAITHLTGNTTSLAAALARGNLDEVVHFAAVIAAFVTGATLSGFLIQDSALQLRRRYGFVLFLVSLLLFASVPLLALKLRYGMYTAACAAGLQNAMVSTYSGSVVRTTHLSGMFTDLGIFLGHAMRGLAVDTRRLRLCLVVISGFLLGGVIGALSFDAFGYSALLLPAIVTGAVSIAYLAYGYYKGLPSPVRAGNANHETANDTEPRQK